MDRQQKIDALLFAANYEKFLMSLRTWANTTIISKVRPLMVASTDIIFSYPVSYSSATPLQRWQHITKRNINQLMNRKLRNIGNLHEMEWLEPSLHADYLESLDLRTLKYIYQRNAEKAKSPNTKVSPVQHPIYRYLPSYLQNEDWVDNQGKTLADYRDEITREILDIAATQKDTDYVGKPVSAYLTARIFSPPYFHHDSKETPLTPRISSSKTRWKPDWYHLLSSWQPILQTIAPLLRGLGSRVEIEDEELDRLLEAAEKDYHTDLPLENLLREMVFVLEIFELDEKVLELAEFEIESRYQSDDLDEGSMREVWNEGLQEDLTDDELLRFENYPEEFQSDYSFSEFLGDLNWSDEELVRGHGNKIKWIYDKDSIFLDPNTAPHQIHAPSPFSKQYAPYQLTLGKSDMPKYSSRDKIWKEPKYNLIGMRWGTYAHTNTFPIATHQVNENPSNDSTFIPINLPLGPIELADKVKKGYDHNLNNLLTSPTEIVMDMEAGYGNLEITYSLKREVAWEPVVIGLHEWTTYSQAAAAATEATEDIDEEAVEAVGKHLNFEDGVGLHDLYLNLNIQFTRGHNRPINFVLGMPQKILDLSTN